jgi:hypothetical protein
MSDTAPWLFEGEGGGVYADTPQNPLWGLVVFGAGQKMPFSRGKLHVSFRTKSLIGPFLGFIVTYWSISGSS